MSQDLKFIVSPARPEDAAELTRIAHAAKRHWGYPDEWMALWRDQLTVTAQDIASQPTFVARNADGTLGFCAVSQRGEVASLEHLWVLPDVLGRGVGRALFDHAAGYARLNGATDLKVELDPHAVGFYRQMDCLSAGETTYELDGQLRSLPVLWLALQPELVDAR